MEIIGIIIIVITAILSFIVGYYGGKSDFKREAVLKGKAEYTIDPAGYPTWQWKKTI
jgi:hypothetical protein